MTEKELQAEVVQLRGRCDELADMFNLLAFGVAASVPLEEAANIAVRSGVHNREYANWLVQEVTRHVQHSAQHVASCEAADTGEDVALIQTPTPRLILPPGLTQ